MVPLTDGYSASDINKLCREAAARPLREIGDIESAVLTDIREITYEDLELSLNVVKKSCEKNRLKTILCACACIYFS